MFLFGLESTVGAILFIILGFSAAGLFYHILYRLSIMLPALAIGKSDFGFKRAWNETKGLGWNFVVIGFVLYFAGKLLFATQAAVIKSIVSNDSLVLHYTASAFDLILTMIFYGYCISVLTASYAMFVGRKDQADVILTHS